MAGMKRKDDYSKKKKKTCQCSFGHLTIVLGHIWKIVTKTFNIQATENTKQAKKYFGAFTQLKKKAFKCIDWG